MCAAPFHNFGHKNGRLTQKQLNSFKDADADASLIGDYVGVVGCDGRAPEGYTCSGPRLGMEELLLFHHCAFHFREHSRHLQYRPPRTPFCLSSSNSGGVDFSAALSDECEDLERDSASRARMASSLECPSAIRRAT